MYALIEFAGKQFKVEEGNSIKVPYIDSKIGSKITIDKILYMDDGKNKMVGNPLVPGIKIDGEITSHGRERKVVVFKFKRRKGYQKKNGHKQEYTLIQINDLNLKGKKTVPKKASPPKKKTTAAKSIKKNAMNTFIFHTEMKKEVKK